MLRSVLSSSPFDRVAEEYDNYWTNTPSGVEQRRAVWRAIDPYFRGLESVLDLGCGTGADALHLKTLGVSTYAIDASAAMVVRARALGVNAHHRSIEDLATVSFRFDGAISNFGALNCIPSLASVAVALRRLIRPGGPVALCLIGPACFWESAYFLARGHLKKAVRRMNGVATSSLGIAVRYPSHAAVLSAFRVGFRLIHFEGIGFCVPPSYVRIPKTFVRFASVVDRHVAHLPPFRSLSDHRLYLFERV